MSFPLPLPPLSRRLRRFRFLFGRGISITAKLRLHLGGQNWVEVILEVGVEALALVGFGEVNGESGDSQDGSVDLHLES